MVLRNRVSGCVDACVLDSVDSINVCEKENVAFAVHKTDKGKTIIALAKVRSQQYIADEKNVAKLKEMKAHMDSLEKDFPAGGCKMMSVVRAAKSLRLVVQSLLTVLDTASEELKKRVEKDMIDVHGSINQVVSHLWYLQRHQFWMSMEQILQMLCAGARPGGA